MAGGQQGIGPLPDLVQRATGLAHTVRHALERVRRRTNRVGTLAQAVRRTAQVLEGGAGFLHQRRQVGLVGLLGKLADIGSGLAQIADGVHQLPLVRRSQQLADALCHLVQLGQQTGALVRQARNQAETHGNAPRLVVIACQNGRRWPGIVELNKGQSGHTLKAQRGKGRLGNGCCTVHNDANQHIAQGLRVQDDGLHAPHRHALVAHRCLHL